MPLLGPVASGWRGLGFVATAAIGELWLPPPPPLPAATPAAVVVSLSVEQLGFNLIAGSE